MAEPVTIGGQTFIKNEKGWIDQKTKAKAPEGLISLLDKVSKEQSPEGMKKRAILDNTYTIKLGDSEYIWDMNNQIFVDKKTKNPVPKHLSSIIEAAAGMKKAGAEDKSKAASSVVNNMGSTGQAAKQKVTTRTGSGQLPAPNIKINSPIVQMIEKLATIDGYLKQRLANDVAMSNSQRVSAKEQAIEQPNATPNLKEESVDAEVEKTNKEAQAILVAGAIAAGALFLTQLDPVKETFNSIIGFAKSVYNFATGIAGVINDGLRNIVGTPESRGEQVSNATGIPTSDVRSSSNMSQSTGSGNEAEDGIAFSGPGQTTTSGSQTSSGPATPEEILTAFPGPTTSSTSTPKPTTPTPTSKPATPASTPKPASPTSTSKPATPVMAKPNDPFAAYTGSAGKLSNDPAVRNKAFSTAPKTSAAPNATSEIPKNDIVALGNYLVGQGAEKSKMEHLALSGRVGDHSANSRHKRGMAIDVNFPGPNEASLLDALEPQLRAAGYNTIWRKKDHTTHMHVSVGGPEGGDSYGSGEGMFQQVATAGVELTKGAMEAIGTILRAGLGEMTPTSGSQLSTVNDTMSGNIARAARERTATVASTKTPKPVAVTKSDPVNMNAPSGSSTIQNMPTSSDKAGVEFYLTRMGFPKIIYTQTSRGATLR